MVLKEDASGIGFEEPPASRKRIGTTEGRDDMTTGLTNETNFDGITGCMKHGVILLFYFLLHNWAEPFPGAVFLIRSQLLLV